MPSRRDEQVSLRRLQRGIVGTWERFSFIADRRGYVTRILSKVRRFDRTFRGTLYHLSLLFQRIFTNDRYMIVSIFSGKVTTELKYNIKILIQSPNLSSVGHG
jgi:hypothetical protein